MVDLKINFEANLNFIYHQLTVYINLFKIQDDVILILYDTAQQYCSKHC